MRKNPKIVVWTSSDDKKETHIYCDGEWLFGVNNEINRSQIIEIMKMFKLEYPYELLNQL